MSERDKAMFLLHMKRLKQKWDAEDRREIGELRRRYYRSKNIEEKEIIANTLRKVFGVKP